MLVETSKGSGGRNWPSGRGRSAIPDTVGRMGELSREALELRYRQYRRSTMVLLVLCAFLVVVVIGQAFMTSGATDAEADEPATAAMSAEGQATAAGDEATAAAEEAGAAATAEVSTVVDSPLVRREAGDPMAIGAVDAPIVLIEWLDLRCPFCAAFHRDSWPTLLSEYVETGQVRIEIHDVAFFGEQSEDAAVAARAAGNQGLYFEYLGVVFDAAPTSGHADLPRETLVEYAVQAGVPDMAQFEADLDDPLIRVAVQESTTNAQSVGVNAVPFFVTGERAISGAQPVAAFQEFLNEALANQAAQAN